MTHLDEHLDEQVGYPVTVTRPGLVHRDDQSRPPQRLQSLCDARHCVAFGAFGEAWICHFDEQIVILMNKLSF